VNVVREDVYHLFDLVLGKLFVLTFHPDNEKRSLAWRINYFKKGKNAIMLDRLDWASYTVFANYVLSISPSTLYMFLNWYVCSVLLLYRHIFSIPLAY